MTPFTPNESSQFKTSQHAPWLATKFSIGFYGYPMKPYTRNASSRNKSEYVSSRQVKNRGKPIFASVTGKLASCKHNGSELLISYSGIWRKLDKRRCIWCERIEGTQNVQATFITCCDSIRLVRKEPMSSVSKKTRISRPTLIRICQNTQIEKLEYI